MPISDDLARRFLHVNLNCESVSSAERIYGDLLGLQTRMRTDPTVPSDGSIMGLEGKTYTATSFLYDARGGRNGCALEAIEWTTPPLKRDTNSDPSRPGIRSALFTVADVSAAATALRDAGLQVSGPVTGLISGNESILALDPDGAVIELCQTPGETDRPATALFAGVRISAVNAVATTKFLEGIGFTVLQAPRRAHLTGEQLAPGGGSGLADCVVARVALAEDGHQFTLTVVQHPDTASHPLPDGGNTQGLYRCAMRVENVETALKQLPDGIEPLRDPVWCPLPGTKIEGLYIAFLQSPDGVLFEFVERPIAYFTKS